MKIYQLRSLANKDFKDVQDYVRTMRETSPNFEDGATAEIEAGDTVAYITQTTSKAEHGNYAGRIVCSVVLEEPPIGVRWTESTTNDWDGVVSVQSGNEV